MRIYYVMLEARPSLENEEREEIAGAYINCWIQAKDKTTAIDKAVDFVTSEGWDTIRIEEIGIVRREKYADVPESLECFDRAVSDGVGAIFYTWVTDDEDNESDGDATRKFSRDT